jgi:hypothetical protein
VPLVAGLDGSVLLPAPVAEVFAPLLRRAMEDAVRRDGFRFPNAVWDELGALEQAARAARAARARGVVAGVVTTTPETLSPARVVDDMRVSGVLSEEVGVPAAAEILGRSRQAVLARINRGTLPARHDERGHWMIRRENLGGPS